MVVAPTTIAERIAGGINAITKQGTNETHGSAYTYFNNQNMYGKYSAYAATRSRRCLSSSTVLTAVRWAAPSSRTNCSTSSARAQKNSYPPSTYPGYTSNLYNQRHRQQIADQYKNLTGIEEAYGERDIEQKSFGLLARVDWNISEKHKLAVRYQHNNSL